MKNPTLLYGQRRVYAFCALCLLVPLWLGITPLSDSMPVQNINTACVADFYASDTLGCKPLTVTFTDNSQGAISSYQWFFTGGSPSTATGVGPHTVTYSSAGNYSVTLTIACREGDDSITKTNYITVRDCACTADFNADETSGCAPMTVTFTDNSSSSATSWYWTFTGGSPASATGAGPHQVTYNSVGAYHVSLTVYCGDTDSDTETKGHYITVDDCECEADFSGKADGTCAPVTVVYTDASTNAQSYNWTFTGGSPATAHSQGPHTVTYATAGTFGARLAIVCNNGQSSIKTRKSYIKVTDCNMDWGDAPSPYPTTSADNGAYHKIKNDLYLGQSVDSESDGTPDADAWGDDDDATTDDEDGVYFTAYILQGQTTGVQVIASDTAVCNAWMDFNGDGDWADADEQIIANFPAYPGVNQFSYWVPANAKSGETYARFRLSSQRGLSYTGAAEDGEVEDYKVIVGKNGPLPDGTQVCFSICMEVDVQLPDGSPEHLEVTGTVFAEADISGAGTATDTDGNGRDQVKAKESGWTFATHVTSGSDAISLGLSSTKPSPGIVEETANNTPGILDVPPFTATGSAQCEFDFYFYFTYQSKKYYASQPLFMKATITSLPPSGAIDLTAPASTPITTVDENGQQTGFKVTAIQMCGGAGQDQYDYGDAPASYQGVWPSSFNTSTDVLLGKLVDSESSALTGSDALGDDNDDQDDEDGITFLTPLIPGQPAIVQVDYSQCTAIEFSINGYIDFDGNGQWDLPQEKIFALGGSSAGTIKNVTFDVPPSAKQGATFARFFAYYSGPTLPGGRVNGEIEDYKINIGGDEPQPDVTIIRFDVCFELDLQLPDGAVEHLTLNGTAIANATINSSGTAVDLDGDGRDEVTISLVHLALNPVTASMGTVTVALNPFTSSAGEIEELANTTPGILDIQPFTASGSAKAHLGIYLQFQMSTGACNAFIPVIMTSYMSLLPPVNASLDAQTAVTYIDLLDVSGSPSGLQIRSIEPCAPTQEEYDFGDAPAPYPTLKAQNGAYGLIDKNVTLGSLIDGETDGQPGAGAVGDDNNGMDDEDGFNILSPVIPGQYFTFEVILGKLDKSQPLTFHCWFDFNGDGSWAGDRIASWTVMNIFSTPLYSYSMPLTYLVPANAKPGISYARCILMTDNTTMPGDGTGYAGIGEVEDIQFTIERSTSIYLGDRVWEDLDQNGIQDMGEPGLANVTVELYANNTKSSTTTTDANGMYQFTGLNAGQYSLKFILPSGFVFSPKDQGTDDLLDSDADPTSGMTAAFTLNQNTVNPQWDAGMYRGGEELYDFGDAPAPYPTLHAQNGAYTLIDPDIYFGKSIDGENDGQPHSTAQGDDNAGLDDEDGLTIYTPLVPGQNFHLAVTVTTNESVWSTVWIDYDGDGNWELGEALAASNLMNSNQYALHSIGTMPATAKPGTTYIRCLLATDEKSYPSADGYQGKGEVEDYQITLAESAPTFLGDFVWHDANHNGIHESGETGLANVAVQLFKSSGSLVSTTTTDVNGFYAFTNVAPDDYYLQFSLPGGYVFSPQDKGSNDYLDSDADVATGRTAVFTAAANTIYLQWDAGMIRADAAGGIDFGDAPDDAKAPRYPTLAAHNGASHTIVPGYFLGGGIDGENDGQPETHALGDDNAGIDDEDGVHFAGPFILGYCTVAQVVSSKPGYLNVWMDINIDGDWNDAAERILVDFPIPGGLQVFCFSTPTGAVTGTTFMRFRFCSYPGLGCDDAARDGEVEDYEIEILDKMPEYDFGDAPDPTFPTLHSHSGAYHVITAGIYLGVGVDAEVDGQPDGTATGDDLNGSDDDDGVIFPGPWVPGHMTEVLVNPSVPGYISAWADFNADGDWLDTDEQLCMDQPVSPTFTLLSISVPATAMQGSITVRFRFSTYKSITSIGMAKDGEVEDYMVEVGELGRPVNKWSQPPLHNKKSDFPKYFWGWDQPSVSQVVVLADDWYCHDNRPITSIHWWGSYQGWEGKEPPLHAPSRFHIGIWTDHPASPERPWSHPDKLIWEKKIERAALNERIVGADYFPPSMQRPDSCYRYDLILPPDEWFHQVKDSTVFWLSIAAIYDKLPDAFVWGWKTRPHFFNDDAVLIEQPKNPGIGAQFGDGKPIGELWDAAFELGTLEDHSQYDYGDTPVFYPVLFEDNGALHLIREGIHLGRGIDPESNGQPDEKALGDDHNGLSDEDGVFFITPLDPGRIAKVEVLASARGRLSAWIDFDGNGHWDNAEDRIFCDRLLMPGLNTLEFPVPPISHAMTTFARFRFSTVNPRSAGGLAIDGEVEDYAVEIHPTSVDQEKEQMPLQYELLQNYPNPFNPNTGIVFALPSAQRVRLAIYDLMGREIRVLMEGPMPAGRHTLKWDGQDPLGITMPSGIYLYRITAGPFTQVRKMLLLK